MIKHKLLTLESPYEDVTAITPETLPLLKLGKTHQVPQ
jgi:hypothetical protein